MKKQIPHLKVFVLLGAIILLLLAHEMYYDFLSDDAFISFRYVKNFVRGHGLVYNIGERVEGYTNFLWVLLLSGFGILGFDIVVVSRIMGALFSIATVLMVYRFSARHYPYLEQGYLRFLAPTLLACNGAYAVWALSGMETVFFTFLLFVTMYRFMYEVQRPQEKPLSIFLFGLTALTRPEGIILFVASLIAMSMENLRRNGKPFTKAQVILIMGFCLIYIPYFLWRWNYYGWVMPNTFYAKVDGGYFRYLRGVFYVMKFVRAYGGLLVFSLPVLLFLKKGIKFNIVYLTMVALAFLAYIIWVGGDGLVSSRFFVPILPSLYLLIQGGFSVLSNSIAVRFGKRRANFIVAVLVVALLGGSLEASYNIRRQPYLSIIRDRERIKNLVKSGHWFRQYAKPGDSISVSVAGAIPYYSELYSIDRLGLTDEHIAHREMSSMGRGSAGHEKRDLDYVMSKRPTYHLTDWPTPARQDKPPIVLDDGTRYRHRSIRIGRGRFLIGFGLQEADLWLNFYQLVEKEAD